MRKTGSLRRDMKYLETGVAAAVALLGILTTAIITIEIRRADHEKDQDRRIDAFGSTPPYWFTAKINDLEADLTSIDRKLDQMLETARTASFTTTTATAGAP